MILTAMAYRKYSKDYVRAETFAKSRREGLWRGTFEPPWEWRKKFSNIQPIIVFRHFRTSSH